MSDALVIYRDEATGERAELSAAQLGGWAAATAALLTEECGLGPGSRAAVLSPPHWQTAAVLLGAWSAGLDVSVRPWATAGLVPGGPAVDVTFVERRRIGSWLEQAPAGRRQFVLGLAPAGAPTPDPPAGYRDYPLAVRPHLGAAPPATSDWAFQREYGAVAAEIARARDLTRGDRVLIDVARSEDPLFWLLAPLVAGASVVLCAALDKSEVDAVVAAEKITRVL